MREHGAGRIHEREAVGVLAHRHGAGTGDRERRRAALVGCREARRRARRDLRHGVLEQHAHLRERRRAERRALVVVGEDLLVGPALEGIALGAVLPHADAVAVAVAGEGERRVRGRQRRQRERGEESEHEMSAARQHDGGRLPGGTARTSE